MRAKPSKLVEAAKDLLERQKKLGVPLVGPAASPEFEPPNTKAKAAQARSLTQQLLKRAARKDPPQD